MLASNIVKKFSTCVLMVCFLFAFIAPTVSYAAAEKEKPLVKEKEAAGITAAEMKANKEKDKAKITAEEEKDHSTKLEKRSTARALEKKN